MSDITVRHPKQRDEGDTAGKHPTGLRGSSHRSTSIRMDLSRDLTCATCVRNKAGG